MPTLRSRIKAVAAVTVTTPPTAVSVIVSWPTPAISGQPLAGFVLYRNGAQIASLSAAVRTYTDEVVVPGVSYFYAVQVVSQRGYSSVSQSSIEIVLPQPGIANVAWTAPLVNTAGQSFDNSTNDRTIQKYVVYYGKDNPPTQYTSETVGTSIVISALTSGTWYFRVTAKDGDGDESDASSTGSKVIT